MPNDAQPAQTSHHIRALERGLTIIELLNRANGMTINDVASQADLPRPTAFRFLHTLMDLGYVVYGTRERQYRLTTQARLLSQGYQSSSWVSDIAIPTLDRIAQDMAWPLTLCVLSDGDVTIAHITDQSSQLIVRRVSSGVIVPTLGSAAGTVFLSFLSDKDSDALTAGALPAQEKQALETRIRDCRSDGYSVYTWQNTWALAVPVFMDGHLAAALAVRIVTEGDWTADDNASYIKILIETARQVEDDLAQVKDVALPL